MTSQRPYLLRALHHWILDNGMTPHLLVDATQPGVHVPPGSVQEGKVVLNIADRATQGLEIGDHAIQFSARFNGVSQSVWIPVNAVLAIYARETGAGMAMPPEFEADDAQEADPRDMHDDTPDDTPEPPKRGGHLRVVK